MGILQTAPRSTRPSYDSDLLIAAKAGDAEAFQVLTQRAAPIIFRRALEITSNHHDAEDVLQETLLKGFTHISQFRGEAQLSTWLVRIGLNEAIMMLRKRKRDVPLDPNAGATGRVEESPVAFQNRKSEADTRIVRTEVGGLLNKALNRLPARARQVLCLRYLEGYSIEETAGRMNLSRGSVKAYASRARARLRTELRRLLMPRRKLSRLRA
ncbi:MAG TPA: sigma-70 family RNA polymerase sigma factor [Terriglobia bacterium]|jgi:RNA polymerase sigma-70 factor (ECF subfamily)|nr:sigma-70 family RNA polymerase sigma factor [Terriglobia bacterium]